ncbi:MAG: hypothetical protein RJA22_2933 [Verrucomicrobiota bacterium]
MNRLIPAALLAAATLAAQAADPGPLTLTPKPADPDRPWSLSWDSTPGTLYRVEQTATLPIPGQPVNWLLADGVLASATRTTRDLPPQAGFGQSSGFFRVGLFPRLLDVQPPYLDPSDPNAVLYLLGQGLPSNATVRLNGQPVPSSPSPDPGAWRLIHATNLPAGLTDIRSVAVLVGTNTVATLQLFLPVTLGALPPVQLLQGPAEEPPASPQSSLTAALRQKRWLTSNFRVGIGHRAGGPDDDCDGVSDTALQKKWLTASYRYRTVSLDGGPDDDCDGVSDAARQKRWLTSNFRFGSSHRAGGPDDDCDGVSDTALQKKWLTASYRYRTISLDGGPDDDCDGVSDAARQKRWLTANFRLRTAGAAPSPAKQKAWLTANFRHRAAGVSLGGEDCDDLDNGVFPATGELRLREVDFAVPGRGLGFAWVRTYRSRTGPDTPQGAGWDFSYNVSLTLQSDGTVLLRPGNGRADTFYPTATNTWVRDEYFCEIRDLNADGMPDVVFADTSRWMFHPAGGPAAGRLHQILDRHGNTVTLDYDATGRLTAVIDDLGRTHQVSYDARGRLAGVRDAAGRFVRYEYDPEGNLTAVVSPAVTGTPTGNDFPGGLTNRFAYAKGSADTRLNHNLTACTDALGQTWLTVGYHPATDPASLDFDTVTRLAHGTQSMDWTRSRVALTNSTGIKTVRVWFRDDLGHVQRSAYDDRGRCLELRQYTGRAPDLNAPVTETSNLPVNQLRAEDPDFFETRWSWSRDSLCTLETRPDGSRTQFLHEGDLNPAAGARQRGDLRVVTEIAGEAGGGDLDGDGAPDYTERSWRFDYDPRFGSPPTAAGQPALSRHLHREGIIHRDLATRNVLLSAGRGFVIAETDPRGNVHTAAYDAQGNRVELRAATQASATPPALHFAYNPHGQLTTVTNAPDAGGRRRIDRIDYQTDGPTAGYPSRLTRDAGNADTAATVQVEFDPRGNLTRLVDPRGLDTLLTYNALDQCVRILSPTNVSARTATDLLHDAGGNLVETRTELRDANDVLQHPVHTLAEYNALGHCVAVSRQVSPGAFVTTRFTRTLDGRVLSILSPLAVTGDEPDNRTTLEYDERGLLFRVILAPGSPLALTNTFTYARNGGSTRHSIRSPAGKSDAYLQHRDGFGQLTGITDPMGNTTTLARDRAGRVTRLTVLGELADGDGDAGNVRLAERRWRYDNLGRCLEEQAAFFDPATGTPLGDGARTTTFAHAPNGDLTQILDDRGSLTRFAYDSAGRLSSVTDAKSNLVSLAYDAADHLLALQSEERSDLAPVTATFWRACAVDAAGRVVQQADSAGNTRAWAYDSLGRQVRATDANGNARWASHDDLGRRTRTIGDLDGDGRPDLAIDASHAWTYDANSRCVAETDANNHSTLHAYDARNRLVATRRADGTETSLVWSPRSNLLRVQDPNGTMISNAYDRLDRCIAREIKPGPGVAATSTFEQFAYDGLSRLVLARNNGSEVAFAHDSLGHVTATRQDGETSTCTRDALGNALSFTTPGGLTLLLTHDALGQPTSLSASAGGLPPNPLLQWAYEGPGRLGRVSRTNGINTRLNWNGAVSPPNGTGDFGWRRASRVNHQRATGGTVIDQRLARFDPNQNRTLRAQTHPFRTGGSTLTNEFSYDALNRLRQSIDRTATTAYPVTYALDRAGNRIEVTDPSGPAAYAMDPTPAPGPADAQVHQYTLTPLGAQAFDDNGNLVARTTSAGGQTAFQYDYANRLVAVLDLSSGAPVPVATYDYDALGRRLRRTTAGASPLAPPEVTEYLYGPGPGEDCDDGDAVLETRVNGSGNKIYFWGGADLVARLSPTGQPEFYHTDDLGNVLALTDVSGNVLERCDYDAFGTPAFLNRDGIPLATNAAPSGNPFLARGQRWDPETGFYQAPRGRAYAHYSKARLRDSAVQSNPLYQDRHKSGQNPFFEPRSNQQVAPGQTAPFAPGPARAPGGLWSSAP